MPEAEVVVDPAPAEAGAQAEAVPAESVAVDPAAEQSVASDDPWGGLRDSYMSRFTDEKEKEAVSKWLGRYATPLDAIDASRKVNEQFKRGEIKLALPKNATPEQIKAYQTENGIPETSEGYFSTALPDGLVLSDADKPIFDDLAKTLHKAGASTSVAHSIASWYADWSKGLQEGAEEQRAVQDAGFAKETAAALKKTWGGEYQLNINHANNFASKLGEDAAKVLREARTADGRFFFDDPVVVSAFANLARELDPISTVVGGGGEAALKNINDEITEIENVMRTNRAKYDRENMRDRLDSLLTMQKKYSK